MNKKIIIIVFVFYFFNVICYGERMKLVKNLNYKCYSYNEILDFENKFNVKIPSLAKKIYTNEYNLKKIIFETNKKGNFIISKIFPLFKTEQNIKESVEHRITTFKQPTLRVIPFGLDDLGRLIMIDDIYLWFSKSYDGYILLSFTGINDEEFLGVDGEFEEGRLNF